MGKPKEKLDEDLWKDKHITCRLERFKSDDDTTLGRFYVQGRVICFIVEDQKNAQKVWGEARITGGEIEISYRYAGRFHTSYKKKFADIHKGILCVHNPELKKDWKIKVGDTVFQYVLIHLGNTDYDTAGCLLPNTTVDHTKMRGYNSTGAYRKLYTEIRKYLDKGLRVKLIVEDNEPS